MKERSKAALWIDDAFVHLIGSPATASIDIPNAIRVDTDIGPLWLHANDRVITPWIREYGTWEVEMGAFLVAALTPGMCVLDIGANIGYHSILAARKVEPDGIVLALEPDPGNFSLLCSNLRLAGVTNVLPIRIAAADFTGRTRLSLSETNTGDHRILQDVAWEHSIEVACACIDDLLHPEARVDVVKIDIQGGEHRAVRGMQRTMAHRRPLLLVEYWPMGIRAIGDDATTVLRTYRETGHHITLLEQPQITSALPDEAITQGVEALDGRFGTLILRPGLASDADAFRTGTQQSHDESHALIGEMSDVRARLNAMENQINSWRDTALGDLSVLKDDLRTAETARVQAQAEMDGWRNSISAQLAGIIQELTEITNWRRSLERDVGIFQQTVTEHLGDIHSNLRHLTEEVTRTDASLYALPYMSDPDRLRIKDASGRAVIGFQQPAPPGTDLYRGFEDLFRGPEAFIRERQRVYLPYVADHGPVVDIGCGRGEFLDLLAEAHITAVGVDPDPGMVMHSRAKGHIVYQEDALSYFTAQPDHSIGAIFAAQVIEHLPYDDLIAFFVRAREKLSPGGVLIAETVNPHALPALKMFWIDLTHRAPIFPEVATMLCWLTGYQEAVVIFPNGTGDLEEDRRVAGEFAIIAHNGSARNAR